MSAFAGVLLSAAQLGASCEEGVTPDCSDHRQCGARDAAGEASADGGEDVADASGGG